MNGPAVAADRPRITQVGGRIHLVLIAGVLYDAETLEEVRA